MRYRIRVARLRELSPLVAAALFVACGYDGGDRPELESNRPKRPPADVGDRTPAAEDPALPTVWADAGAARWVSEDEVRLDGSGSGSRLQKPLTYNWQGLAGPLIDESAAVEGMRPTVRLSQPGCYVFLLEVSDGDAQASDEVMICREVAEPHTFVLHISVDGLRPDVIENLGYARLPQFYRMQEEGSYTHNARTDYDLTVTLPNHTSQLTGRPVLGALGHGWVGNSFVTGTSFHENKGSYVASVFDVVHDHGLRTALLSGKSKFQIYLDSYGTEHGGIDLIGEDNGTAKIDYGLLQLDQALEVNALIASFQGAPHHYTFFHFANTDAAGHSTGWTIEPESVYALAVQSVDADLGRIFAAIEASPVMAGNTTVLLTSDHGGTDFHHASPDVVTNFTIPFYAWGRGVAAGRNLYDLNLDRRQHPGVQRIPPSAPLQPIVNGDAANVACRLLGLPPVPGSSINFDDATALLTAEVE